MIENYRWRIYRYTITRVGPMEMRFEPINTSVVSLITHLVLSEPPGDGFHGLLDWPKSDLGPTNNSHLPGRLTQSHQSSQHPPHPGQHHLNQAQIPDGVTHLSQTNSKQSRSNQFGPTVVVKFTRWLNLSSKKYPHLIHPNSASTTRPVFPVNRCLQPPYDWFQSVKSP